MQSPCLSVLLEVVNLGTEAFISAGLIAKAVGDNSFAVQAGFTERFHGKLMESIKY